jgi:hypothetical protein
MAKSRKMWTFSPAKKEKPSVTPSCKLQVEAKAKELIESVLKPNHVQPPPKDRQFNYIIDIGVKWNRGYFYFISTYACPGPTVHSSTFESKFARLEYLGDEKFALSFMRHNGEWVELFTVISLDDCMKAIQNDPWFQP